MDQIIETSLTLLASYGWQLLGSIVIFLVGRWLVKFSVNLAKRTMEKSQVDETLTNFATNILYYLLFALVIIAALANLGVPTTSLVAVLGGLTLAIGLALQDSLGNFAAGIMIILLRPYKLNDTVELNGETGEVIDIKIFHTKLINLQKKVIFIPNNEVIGGNIVNYSDAEFYRQDMVFGIGYDDDIRQAKEILLNILKSHDKIVDDPSPVVVVGELADSSVNLVAKPWIKFEDHSAVRAYVTEQVKLQFDEAKISIPYPQRDVHMFNAN